MKKNSERCLPIGMCMGVVLLALLVLPMAGWAVPFSETNKWAWVESAGYLNFRATNAVALTATAHVDGENGYLTGWAWSEMLGWIKLGNTDGGVPYANTDATNWGVNVAGALVSGFAWSESAGWINFAPTNATMTNRVTFSAATWQFDGYAWSELAGWVNVRGDGETPLYALETEPALAVLGVLGTNGSAIESGGSFQLPNGSKYPPLLLGTSQTHTFSITNSGNDTLELGTYGTNGTDAAYFEISGVPASVAAGSSSTFTVAYTPEAVGSHTATVSFAGNDPAAPYLLHLGGSCFGVSTNVGPFAGGNSITITNGNFGAITNVLVGGVAATIVDWGTDWVTVVMPAAAGVGTVDIVVQTSDNGDITLADAYTYNPAGVIDDSSVTNAYVIGAGSMTNAASGYGPINVFFRSRHFQFVYTTNDLVAAGLPAQARITHLGLDVVQTPSVDLPHFQIRMKHTAAEDMTAGFEADDLTVCYSSASYNPVAGGFDMLAFSTPFVWNGTESLILDTAFAQTASYDSSGRSTYDEVVSRGRTLQSDSADQSIVFSEGILIAHLPRIRILTESPSDVIAPSSGSWTGGYEVVISGTNLSAGVVGDIEWVTLAGVTAQVQSVSGSTQLVVTAGQANVAGLGDVRVFSTSHGETVASNAFTYEAAGMLVLGTNTAVAVTNGAVASAAAGTRFGPMLTNDAWVVRTLSITNSGTIALQIGGGSLTGAGFLQFAVTNLPLSVGAGSNGTFDVLFDPAAEGTFEAALELTHDSPLTASPYVVNLLGLVDITPPVIASTGIVQTVNTDTNAGNAQLLDMEIDAQDSSEVTSMVVNTFRDYGDYVAVFSNGTWHVQDVPLYSGPNYIDVVSIDELGNTATNQRLVQASDALYNSTLRSGQMVTHIDFPDNLEPGSTNTVNWSVLSYVPVRAGVLAGVAGTNGWQYFRNGIYAGHTNSNWKINGRPARVYSFTCPWPAPQMASTDSNINFKVAFLHAQMDGALYMSAVIPDDVDPLDRAVLGQSKLIERTVKSTGGATNALPHEVPYYVPSRVFEYLPDYRRRSGGTISWLNMPTNLVAGVAANASWKVLSYVPIRSSFRIVNVGSETVFTTNTAYGIEGERTGAVQSSWRFSAGGQTYYSTEYTFAANFMVPTNAVGTNQIYFLNQDLTESNSSWMSGNIDAGADPRPYEHNGITGRFIDRVIDR